MIDPRLTAIQADFATFKPILFNFLNTIPNTAWDERTGSRDKDWTLHQTLAHLVSIARLLNLATVCARDKQSMIVEGLSRREDLIQWNEAEIANLTQNTPNTLIKQLTATLDEALSFTETLTTEELDHETLLPVYNRPARVIDCIDWQLSHAGTIHAAQITRPTDSPPLWEQYPTDMLNRQIDRFMRHFSYAYWESYAEDLNAILNFHIGGEAGGDWHIAASPDGGYVASGHVDNPDFSLQFSSPAVLFGIFTVHLPLMDAIQNGQFSIEGDASEALRVIRLFGATPPRT